MVNFYYPPYNAEIPEYSALIQIMNNIRDVVIKTLVSCEAEIASVCERLFAER